VVTRRGYQPGILVYNKINGALSAEVRAVRLNRLSDDIVSLELNPGVHRLGNNPPPSSPRWQRSSGILTLARNFNLTAGQADSTEITLSWFTKDANSINAIWINGQEIRSIPNTIDGLYSFSRQTVPLQVGGVLVTGSNTIEIRSTDEDGDPDDFEFAFIGITDFK